MILDIKTLMVLYVIINVIGVVAITIIWTQTRKRFAGISFWLVDMVLQAAGSALIIMRGLVADFISIVIANIMIQAGIVILFIGLERFVGKKSWQIHNYILLAVFAFIITYYSFIQPSLAMREIALSSMVVIFTFQCCWLLLRRVAPGLRQITRITGILFGGYVVVNFARIILLLVFPLQSNDLFKSGAVDSLAIVLYITLSACLTISLIVMVNRRLLGEVRVQEENTKSLAKFPDENPNPVLRVVRDGTIMYANKPSQILMDIWNCSVGQRLPDYWQQLGAEAIDSGLIKNYDCACGKQIFAVTLIPIAHEGYVNIYGRDVTERRQAEEALVKSEEKYRLLTESSLTGIYIVQDGKYAYINNRFALMHGYKGTAMEGVEHMALVPPDEREFVRKTHAKLFNGEQIPIPMVGQRLRKDGEAFWAEIITCAIQYSGKPAILGNMVDITERKRAEEALMSLYARQKAILDAITDIIIEVDNNKVYTWVNNAGIEFFGEGVIGKEASFYFEGEQETYKLVQPLFNGDENLIYIESWQRRKDGQKRLLAWWCKTLKDKNGNVKGALSSARDITENKLMENNLRFSEEKYRTTARLSADFSYSCIHTGDDGYKVDWITDAFFTLTGYSEAELQEQGCWLFVSHPDDREMATKSLLELKDGESDTREFRIVTRDGSVHYIINYTECQAYPEAPGGLKLLGAVQDITERKQAEEELRLRSQLLDNVTDSIFVADLDSNILYANEAACTSTGYTREELLKMKLRQLNTEASAKLRAPLLKELIEKGSIIFETEQHRKDGSILPLEVHSSIVEVGNNKLTLNVARDISDHKRMEEERQRVAKLESVGILAGGIAHDFNNILTAILGNISLASMKTQPDDETNDILKEAEKASLRAKDLTQQLLTFSKGGAPIKKLSSLSELLKDTASFALRGSNIKCQFSIADDLWHAEIDEGQISQVINNLVINAQQAMPAGGTIEIHAENITLTGGKSLGKSLPLKKGDYIRIAVKDQGTGIPRELLDKIFDPFFTTKQKGSGLGLATTFSIIRNHSGHISVGSELGTGSTFYVYLPASTKKVTRKKDKKEEATPVGKARILVMDDEPMIRDIAHRMLKNIGYEDVECATDGAEAVKLYEEAMKSGNQFTAVILDLTIPGGMGGKEAIKKLLEINPGVKAIVSSGYTDTSAMAEYKKYGFKGMVAKPYTLNQLRTALHELIG